MKTATPTKISTITYTKLMVVTLALFAANAAVFAVAPVTSVTRRPVINCGDTITARVHGAKVVLNNSDPVVK